MKKINIRRAIYQIKHRYLTLNNVVVVIALLIGVGWAWGSVQMMQRNFALQKEVDAKKRDQLILDLEVQNLTFERRYYQTDEYKELALRQRTGMVKPGEKVLFLPPNSEKAVRADEQIKSNNSAPEPRKPSNMEQWVNFLFGGRRLDG